MSDLKVLLTGATGYIGGSVLSTLLASKNPALEGASLSALVRGADKARVFTENGVQVELFDDLDQSELLETIGSKYDVVIQCVIGTHITSAAALIRGLGERLRNTGKQTYYIHLSGASNISDLASSGKHRESHVFSDKENIYAYEKYLESLHSYVQRANEINVVETGLATGVRTTILMPPTVWGTGTGFFNRLSVQIPMVFQAALKRGQAIRVGDYDAVYNHVHIEDLTKLYEMVLGRIAEGKGVPYGEKGILFSDGGEFTWSELYQGVAKALKKRGKLATEEMYTLSLKEAADDFAGGDEYDVEVGFVSNGRMRADVARDWGWKPTKTHEDFLNTFDAEADAILDAVQQGLGEVIYMKHLKQG